MMGADHPYGARLPLLADVGIGPTMHVAAAGNTAYAIGRGTLYTLDVSVPRSPVVVGRLEGLGSVRQVAVAGNVACVTAREGGMFIVDVSDRSQPRRLCHYDTVEWATGIAMQGPLAYVACRHFGVELVDIRDPTQPRHVSIVSTGEAQSVAARGGYVYTGVWGTRELVVIDVGNPRRPVISDRCPLDGYGDGLTICGDYCYAATGHHARGARRGTHGGLVTREMILSGYGCGHGLEVFHLADPAHPVFVSRIKLPPLYCIFNDMWSVQVAGDYAFVADTWNGVFVIDISNPADLRPVAHTYLEYSVGGDMAAPGTDDPRPLAEVYARSGYCLQPVRKPVGGVFPLTGHLLVAGIYSDLHVVEAMDLAKPPVPQAATAAALALSAPAEPTSSGLPGAYAYQPEGQVRQVAASGERALIAAGMAGLHVVHIATTPQLQQVYNTTGFAMDVQIRDHCVYVAEGFGGLSIWQMEPTGSLIWAGHYQVQGQSVKQVVVPAGSRYALLDVGADEFHVVDVSDPAAPALVLREKHLGLLYGDQLAGGLLHNRYACAFWHASGIYFYDVGGAESQIECIFHYPYRMSAVDGLAICGEAVLVTYQKRYFLLTPGETRPPEEMAMSGVSGYDLSGKPSIYGHRLLISNRASKRLSIVDITDVEHPKVEEVLSLRGHPGRCVQHGDKLLIPAGHQGLLMR